MSLWNVRPTKDLLNGLHTGWFFNICLLLFLYFYRALIKVTICGVNPVHLAFSDASLSLSDDDKKPLEMFKTGTSDSWVSSMNFIFCFVYVVYFLDFWKYIVFNNSVKNEVTRSFFYVFLSEVSKSLLSVFLLSKQEIYNHEEIVLLWKAPLDQIKGKRKTGNSVE